MMYLSGRVCRSERGGRWIGVLFFLFFFVDSFHWSGVLGGLDFRLSYIVLIIGILYSFLFLNIIIPKSYIYIFAFLFSVSFSGLILHPQIWKGILFQLIGSIPFAYLTYFIVKRGGLEQFYLHYQMVAKFIVMSVFIEQILYLVGGVSLIENIWFFTSVNYQVDSYYRASGILYEPSQVGLLLPPALYLAIRKESYKLALFLFLGIALSFSTLGYIGALFALIFSFKFNSKVAPSIIISIVVLMGLILIVPSSLDRVEKGYNLLSSFSIQDSFGVEELVNMKGTIATLVVNVNIMHEGITDAPLFGHGLASFRYMYEYYLYNLYGDISQLEVIKNRHGGASLFLRMLFEVGILGTIVIFIVYFYRLMRLKIRKKNYIEGTLAFELSMAATIFFICCLIRKDMIVSFYFWMFTSLFIVSTAKKNYRI